MSSLTWFTKVGCFVRLNPPAFSRTDLFAMVLMLLDELLPKNPSLSDDFISKPTTLL